MIKLKEDIIIKSCIEGEAIELNKVKDEAFASESIGKGVGIIPKKGILYAPADGENFNCIYYRTCSRNGN